jgi:hypothetical protein
MSFLAFHMYHKVVQILWRSASDVIFVIKAARASCTPSCSKGNIDDLKGGLAENQTALTKGQ